MDLLNRIKSSFSFRTKDIFLRFMKRTASLWPNELYLKIRYYIYFGHKLNLKNPQTFNEKIQWLKLNHCPPIYAMLVDKYLVKKYVAGLIGEKYIIPTIGVWDDADNVDFESLPEKFVLKCNHNSGLGMFICKDKSKIDEQKVRKGLREGLNEKYYKMAHEMQYKGVKPLIIAEEYIEDKSGEGLTDYKFFCFDGVVKMCGVFSNRFSVGKFSVNYYDTNWKVLPISSKKLPSNPNIIVEKPQNFEKMIEIASALSKGFPHVRVDLYNVEGKIYFGELTFTHNGGMDPFIPEEWDYTIGSWIKLPNLTHK